MKQVGTAEIRTAPNAWGRDITATYTRFEVEEQDVGRVLDNYLGYSHRRVQIAATDVGSKIIQMTGGSGWSCWYWLEVKPIEERP